jgi:hypothetical protein
VGGEERGRADAESGSGLLLLVAEHSCVREAQSGRRRRGAYAYRSWLRFFLPCARPQGEVPAAIPDVSELLDVDADQLPGMVVSIALGCRLSWIVRCPAPDRSPAAFVAWARTLATVKWII